MLQEEILFVSEIVDSLRGSDVLSARDEDDIKGDVADRRVESIDTLICRLIALKQQDWPDKLNAALTKRYQQVVDEILDVHDILKSKILTSVSPRLVRDLVPGIAKCLNTL